MPLRTRLTLRKVNSVEATLKRIWASCIGLVLLSACQPTTGLTNRVANNVLPTLISATTPQTAGDMLVLQGRYFGDGVAGENRRSFVILGARADGSGGFRVEPRPEDWAPNRIVMGIPDGVGYGYVFVVVDGVRSNGLPINIGRNLPVNPLATAEPDTEPVAVALELSPGDITMFAGDSQTFAVAGAENIIWSASEGTISGSGQQVTYTAPLTPGTYTVSASSSSRRVNATVTVVTPVNLSISPDVVTLAAGEVQTFRALVDGNGAGNVTWRAPNGGSIEGSGEQVRFVAPNAIGRYQVTVTSSRDPSRSASATIEVREVQVDISPGSIIIPLGSSETFSALVSGAANNTVTWDAPNGGTIGGTGVGSGNTVTFTPPNQIGRYTLTATSNIDPNKFATATINVIEPSVTINPGSVILNLGESQQFTAVVNDSSDSSVRWETPDGGNISGSGNAVTFTPPNTPGNYRVIARSNADSSKAAAATVTVRDTRGSVSPSAPASAPTSAPAVTTTTAPSTPAPATTPATTPAITTTSTPTPATPVAATPTPSTSSSLRLQPINVRLVPGQIRAFEALAPSGVTLRWESPDGGDIIGRGRIVSFVAPERPGTYRLVAINEASASDTVTATIVVGEAVNVRIVPGDIALSIGGQQEFGAIVTGADDDSVLWDAPNGGTLLEGNNNTVTFISPPEAGQYRLVARSNFDPNRTAEITITVR